MEKELYALFYDELDGIISRIRNNEDFSEKTEMTKAYLTRWNEKFQKGEASSIEIKVMIDVVSSLSEFNYDPKVCRYLNFEFKPALKDLFLSEEEYQGLGV